MAATVLAAIAVGVVGSRIHLVSGDRDLVDLPDPNPPVRTTRALVETLDRIEDT